MEEMVYNGEPVGVTYYNAQKGGKVGSSSEGEFNYWPPYVQTQDLMNSVLDAIQLDGFTIAFHVENLVPYWLWVDKGHRVIYPDPNTGELVEPGTFVMARPFQERIQSEVEQLMETLMFSMRGVGTQLVQSIKQWVLTGSITAAAVASGNMYPVKYPPPMGYGAKFNKWVGIQ
jgi:hypothetical protein